MFFFFSFLPSFLKAHFHLLQPSDPLQYVLEASSVKSHALRFVDGDGKCELKRELGTTLRKSLGLPFTLSRGD